MIAKLNNMRKYFMLAPALVVILVTSTYPLLYTFWLGFHKWLLSESPVPQEYVGFKNYIDVLTDPNFLGVAKTSFVYTAMSVLLSVVIGLAMALLLQKPGKINAVLKTTLIFPYAISPALKGFTFGFMLNPSFGVLDRFLKFIFPFAKDFVWLGEPVSALFWLAMSEVWGWAPLIALMFIGALGSISTSIFEAARLDGTSNLQLFTHITLPLLKPIILIVILLRTIFSLKLFDQVVTMTGGGPGTSTQTFNYYIYQNAFRYLNMGYSGAVAAILVIIMGIVAFLYVKSLSGRGL